jgi:hypothetical protein
MYGHGIFPECSQRDGQSQRTAAKAEIQRLLALYLASVHTKHVRSTQNSFGARDPPLAKRPV